LLGNPHRAGEALHTLVTGRHSARRGTYRVIYRIDDETRPVTVLAVSPRGDAYRSTGHK
jgi:mRNA-degrading endonuclease RelE of RelBE toxin-antitoxin system